MYITQGTNITSNKNEAPKKLGYYCNYYDMY